MQIRITRTIKKVGLFKKSIELEETLFLYTDVHEDELFPLIKAIGEVVTDHSSPSGELPVTAAQILKHETESY